MRMMCVGIAVLSLAAFAATAQANLLDDGSFDLATNDTRTSNSAWSLTSSITEPDGAVFSTSDWASKDAGGTGVWFKTFGGDPNGITEDSLLTQTVVAPANGDYTLLFWGAREANHLSTTTFASLSSSGTGGSDSVDLNTATFNNTLNFVDGGGTRFSLSLTGVTAGDFLTVSVDEIGGISNPGAAESLMVDQFTLSIPEPTSLALVGLGLLGAFTMRRKR